MKTLFTIIIFFFTVSICSAQLKKIEVDSFYVENNFPRSTSILFLCSDHSFFFSARHISNNISKGTWKSINKQIELTPSGKESLKIKSVIYKIESGADSAIILQFIDYLENPLPNYVVTLYDSVMNPSLFDTNERGIISISRNKYIGFIINDELKNFKAGETESNKMYKIENNTTRLYIKLNYPSLFISSYQEPFPFPMPKEKLIKNKKGIQSLTTGEQYLRL